MAEQSFRDLKRSALQKYFNKMNSQQKKAVFTVNGPVLVLAGAGSGKTTVIVNRIANMINFGDAYHNETSKASEDEINFLSDYIDGKTDDIAKLKDIIAVSPVKPWNILAITFTNKAAGELRTRLSNILGEDDAREINAATFHSACVRILRREIDKLGYSNSFTIYDSDDSQRVIKSCLSDLNVSEQQFPPKAILSSISKAKDNMLFPEDIEASVGGDFRKSIISKVYTEYQKRLKNSNALDFDDIIMLTVQLFIDFPDVLEYYQNRYRYILVDEYQDTNHAQFKLVSLLASEHNNLCVVGDDDQSIYKFRGATIENILNFENQFENTVVIHLEQNYRSTQRILNTANSIIKNNQGRKPKTLWTDGELGDKTVVYKAQDEMDEAKFIAKTILDNVKHGGKFNDNVVLYRMNAQSNIIERAFVQSGIPYRVLGGLKFFDRKEIKDVLAYLAVINNNNDMLRLKRIINEPKRGLGESTLTMLEEITMDLNISPLEAMRNAADYPVLSKKASVLKSLAKMFDTLSDLSKTLPLDKLLDELLDKSGYREYLKSLGDDGINRLENINELKSTMISYANEAEEPSLSSFLEEISLYTDVDKLDEFVDAVYMMTIHSSKGLEFPNVFVVGMEEGIFPSSRTFESEDEIEEERRLAYVAFTRAQKRLYLSNAAQRMLFGTTSRNFPSRFIKEIEPDLIEKIDNTVKATTGAIAVTTVSSIPLQKQIAKIKSNEPSKQPVEIDFAEGDRVKHNIFGEGTVISVRKMANDAMLEVDFDKVGTKKLMANFAKINKIDNN
ncbi:MAG: UvrD-helicase domain-containing protein [Clostridiales bacterium]|nr:UvrD-helicase domain-containing protein [Clostridiales bacterium]